MTNQKKEVINAALPLEVAHPDNRFRLWWRGRLRERIVHLHTNF